MSREDQPAFLSLLGFLEPALAWPSPSHWRRHCAQFIQSSKHFCVQQAQNLSQVLDRNTLGPCEGYRCLGQGGHLPEKKPQFGC